MWNPIIPLYLGYVEDIKKLLFSLTKAEMLEVYNRYSARAPAPLSAQFEDRVDKQTAVKAYQENLKKRSNAPLFPTSMCSDLFEVLGGLYFLWRPDILQASQTMLGATLWCTSILSMGWKY